MKPTPKKKKGNLYFLSFLKQSGLPAPEMEYRFGAIASGGGGKGLKERLEETGLRDWRMDYAWPDHKVALEVEGGVFSGGRHTRGAGFVGDMAKYNAAAVLGWRLLRCQPSELARTATIAMLKKCLIKP